jgi:predicted RNase H-like HicB family nuclease
VLGEILVRIGLSIAAVLGFAAYLYPDAFARKRQEKFSKIADMLSGSFLYSDAQSARTYGLIVGVDERDDVQGTPFAAIMQPLAYTLGALIMMLTAVLMPAPEGGFTALNPETGTTSEGESIEEAIANLREATELYLEEFPLEPAGQPLVTTFQVAEHA